MNIAKIFFLYSVGFILPYLPLKALYLLSDIMGNVMVSEKTSVMKDELHRLFGALNSHESDEILRRAGNNFRKELFEIWTFRKLNSKRIDKMVYLEGLDHLDRALEKGKGVILCQNHFGPYKMVLAALGYKGYKVNQVAINPMAIKGAEESYYLQKILKMELECESSLPAKFIYLDSKGYINKIYRALKNNEIVIVLLDGIIGEKHMTLDFLNSEISISTAGASLSLISGAPALPVFITREDNNVNKVTVHGAFNINNENGKEEYINQWTISYIKLFEDYIRNWPDHYLKYLYILKKNKR